MRRRSGFTLVELMVAMALIALIMAIIAQAFASASKSFRDLKSAGDLARRQRMVINMLRADLEADHFDGRRRLSDPNFWEQGPPREGFFRIWQGSVIGAGDMYNDLEGLTQFRAVDHALHFTVQLHGNRRDDFFTARVPAGSVLSNPALGVLEAKFQNPNDNVGGRIPYHSQWAEVAWFLRPTPDDANGTPLYSLYRRQLLAVPKRHRVGTVPVAQQTQYLEVSAKVDPTNPGNLRFNSPIDLTMPPHRFAMDESNPAVRAAGVVPEEVVGSHRLARFPTLAEQDATLAAADLVLTDVISFDVQILVQEDPTRSFRHLHDTGNTFFQNNGYVSRNARYPNVAPGPFIFDTWSRARDATYDYAEWDRTGVGANRIPLWKPPAGGANAGPTIKAIKINLRSWDPRTELTRQVTLVVAL